ncbi:MAG: barstar family protein [Acidobacteriota bacterium]|nr:barstar family protein [Acidobacteriota bacterium]
MTNDLGTLTGKHHYYPYGTEYAPGQDESLQNIHPGALVTTSENTRQWQHLSRFIQLSDIQNEAETQTPTALFGNPPPGTIVRRLRGGKMRSLQGLMDEFGAALQFFEGFGENWHALKECLSYLDEWLPADQYILLIPSSHQVLIDDPSQLKWLLKTLHEVGQWWLEPITDNEPFNRPSKGFKAIFATMPELFDTTLRRFESAYRS